MDPQHELMHLQYIFKLIALRGACLGEWDIKHLNAGRILIDMQSNRHRSCTAPACKANQSSLCPSASSIILGLRDRACRVFFRNCAARIPFYKISSFSQHKTTITLAAYDRHRYFLESALQRLRKVCKSKRAPTVVVEKLAGNLGARFCSASLCAHQVARVSRNFWF